MSLIQNMILQEMADADDFYCKDETIELWKIVVKLDNLLLCRARTVTLSITFGLKLLIDTYFCYRNSDAKELNEVRKKLDTAKQYKIWLLRKPCAELNIDYDNFNSKLTKWMQNINNWLPKPKLAIKSRS